MNDLVFTDKKGRKCIHGTDPIHPYEIAYINDKGVVAVKSPNDFGGESTDRIRCITWDVLTGVSGGDDYDELLDQGWEKKSGNHHTSVRATSGICPTCGADLDSAGDTDKRVEQAIEFLNSD